MAKQLNIDKDALDKMVTRTISSVKSLTKMGTFYSHNLNHLFIDAIYNHIQTEDNPYKIERFSLRQKISNALSNSKEYKEDMDAFAKKINENTTIEHKTKFYSPFTLVNVDNGKLFKFGNIETDASKKTLNMDKKSIESELTEIFNKLMGGNNEQINGVLQYQSNEITKLQEANAQKKAEEEQEKTKYINDRIKDAKWWIAKNNNEIKEVEKEKKAGKLKAEDDTRDECNADINFHTRELQYLKSLELQNFDTLKELKNHLTQLPWDDSNQDNVLETGIIGANETFE